MSANFNYQNTPVDPSHFAMVPGAPIPRSAFRRDRKRMSTFDGGYLVPVFLDEVLPGDTYKVSMTYFIRMATLLFPFMDSLKLTSFFFFVPNRLVWTNWQRFMGERDPNPTSSIDYLIPTTDNSQAYLPCTLQDYLGLPVRGMGYTTGNFLHSCLPTRAYNLIWNEWFRDENLQDSVSVPLGDGPDSSALYTLLRRGKRHDYFTSCLPWPQKGDAVTIPLGTTAPVTGLGLNSLANEPGSGSFYETGNPVAQSWADFSLTYPQAGWPVGNQFIGVKQDASGYPQVFADLSDASAATINLLRNAFAVQKVLERDARGGTRYTEIIRAHFGVISPDARLQRPEYLGGSSGFIDVNPVAQTSVTATTPQGNLAGVGTAVGHGHGFSKSFTEHGYILGLVHVGADLTYQQGLHKMWSRSTRYDFYLPAFAHLGEQAVLTQEIFLRGNAATTDDDVFGYQERWAEYRYAPSQITGMFRSGITGTLDAWHLAQLFSVAPTLGTTFIQDTPPVSRVVAAGGAADGQQFLFDARFDVMCVRAMPTYSVPGQMDRF